MLPSMSTLAASSLWSSSSTVNSFDDTPPRVFSSWLSFSTFLRVSSTEALFSVESSFIGDADSVDDGLGGGSIRFFFVAMAGRLEEAVAYSQFGQRYT